MAGVLRLGRFTNQPIPGGFFAMEKKHNTKWRKVPSLYADKERKKFTRWKNGIEAMGKLKEGKQDDVFFTEMDEIYRNNSSVTSFGKALKKIVKEKNTDTSNN